MSDLKKIAEDLKIIQSFLNVCETNNRFSVLEKDLLLQKLRTVYERVLFPDTDSPGNNAEMVVPESSVVTGSEAIPISDINGNSLRSEDYPGDPLPEPGSGGIEDVVSASAADVNLSSDKLSSDDTISPSEPKLFRDETMIRGRVDKQVILSLYGDQPVTASPVPGNGSQTTRTLPEANTDHELPADVAPEDLLVSNNLPGGSSELGSIAEELPVPVGSTSFTDENPDMVNTVPEQFPTIPQAVNGPNPQEALINAPGTRKVLGEIIPAAGQSLNERVGQQTHQTDVASKLRSGTLRELRHGIGVNDRFLLINELFGGDAGAYEQTLTHLDTFTTLDDAMIYIQENFGWNPDGEAAGFVVDLLQRKLES